VCDHNDDTDNIMMIVHQVLLLFVVELLGTLQFCGNPHLPAYAAPERLFGRLLPENEKPSAAAASTSQPRQQRVTKSSPPGRCVLGMDGADGDEGSFGATMGAADIINQTHFGSFESNINAQQQAAPMKRANAADATTVRRSERLEHNDQH
jgi:hypothetical protein